MKHAHRPSRVLATAIVAANWMLMQQQPARAAAPVDMAQRAEQLKSHKWGMFICWSFSTFSGKEWPRG